MKWIALSLLLIGIASCKNETSKIAMTKEEGKIYSLFGQLLEAPKPSEKSLEKLVEAERVYAKDSLDIENIIWLGRRIAYTGDYLKAIDVFTKGIDLYPKNPRLFRPRGHRYISIREFDKAISDLKRASFLISGSENQIEKDGLPNARNIPVSTLHGNIYYHLGLAYYLKQNYEKAFAAFLKCKATGENPDNLVSSTHWIYMILKRMGKDKLAEESLTDISENMDVIENISYHNLCLFYKGLKSESDISSEEFTPSTSAVNYGIANWHFARGDKQTAVDMWKKMIQNNSWSSFGNIAAEADLYNLD